jgi:hypothetical protein
LGTLSKFELQGLGFVEYKVVGKFIVQDIYNNQHIYDFQSVLDLSNNAVQFNATTTTFTHPTTDYKTISVVNPIPGLTYRWYSQDPNGPAGFTNSVDTGTSHTVNYGGGAKLYVVGLNSNGCTTSVGTAYRDLEEATPPFEAVTGMFILKQVCDDKLVNVVIPARIDKDETTDGLTWKWFKYGSEEELQIQNMPLNLNPLEDKKYIVKVFDNISNQTETFVFLVWGSQPKYYGSVNLSSNTINWLEINWGFREPLVVVKQLDINSNAWNQKQSLLLEDYSYRYCKLNIAPETKILVMSGPMAFNRLQFLADNQINIEKGVRFTSGCNMWGGLVIQHKSLLKVTGTPEHSVIFENGNFGILLDNTYCCAGEMVWGNNYPFVTTSLLSPYRYTVGDEFTSTLQLEHIDFKNNYFHLYLAQEVKKNVSYLRNSNFTCDPDKMLFPYNPKPSTKGFDKTMTEACIVGYDAWKTNFSPADQLGFFHNDTVGINISECNFSDAFYGIISSFGTLAQTNTYDRIRRISIAMMHNKLDQNVFRVNNQIINMEQYKNSDDWDYSFQNQLANLETYWDTINGYKGTLLANYTDFSQIPANRLSRNGYSIGMLDDNEADTVPGDLSKNLTIGVYATNTSIDLAFSCGSVMNLENNTITSVNGCLPSQPNRLVGAYIGSLGKLNFNEFKDLYEGVYCNYGCNVDEGLVVTGNRFDNLISSLRFNSAVDTYVPNPGLIMSCNTFDFDRNLANYVRTGITFEGRGNVRRIIGGNFVRNTPILEIPAGNSFPVHNRPDRSNLVYNDDNDEVDVDNSSTLSIVADRWLSPPNWTSIRNLTSDIFNYGNPHQLIYYRFSNEFVGKTLPLTSSLIVRGPVPATRKYAITSGNSNITVDTLSTTIICSNINITPEVVFPATGNLTRKNDKNPERKINVINNGVSTILITTSDREEILDYSLFTISGQRIVKNKLNATTISLPTATLAKGIYMLHIATISGILVSKIIVQ